MEIHYLFHIVSCKYYQSSTTLFLNVESFTRFDRWPNVNRPWQIKISVMYVHVFVFYINCSLTYFHIKIFVRVKQKNILLANKPFWQLRRLDDFTVDAIANIFVYERLKISKVSSEHSGTSKMELFVKIVNS